MRPRPLLATFALGLPALAHAADPVSPVSAGSLFQVMGALALVLGVLLGVAWMIKRLNVLPGSTAGVLRVVGGVSVGTRERVVVIELEDTWLVVGVAPGNISALHHCARPATAAGPSTAAPLPSGPAFAQWLKQAIERKPHA